MRLLLLPLIFLSFLWPKKKCIIDEDHFTKLKNDSLFLDVDKINGVKRSNICWVIDTKEVIYIDTKKSLRMRKGWTLRGRTGKERLYKKPSKYTSAIIIKEVDKITLQNFELSSIYTAPDPLNVKQVALIEIDNFDIQRKRKIKPIEIDELKLNNHYSAIWIKRGSNINITNCEIMQNAHQIQLGCLTCDSLNIKDYRVQKVGIRNNKIINGLSFGIDGVNTNGIKTLSNCRLIKIEDNLIKKNNGDGIDLFPGGVDVRITNNIIDSNRINGVEIKMLGKYTPQQTGQIKSVIIENNIISNSRETGIIAYRDNLANYYAKGIYLTKNTIVNSGHYGIHSQVPITITKNTLERNGSCENTWLPRKKCAKYYAGIYLLNIPSGKSSEIKSNRIIDQGFYSTEESAVYWMALNNAANLVIEDNILEITANNPLKKTPHGISIIQSTIGVPPDTIVSQNTFMGISFKEKLCINNSTCYN